MEIFKNSNINFVGKRRLMFAISGFFILSSVISLIIHGGPNYGIDFTGGVSLELNLSANDDNLKKLSTKDLRESFAGTTFSDAKIQQISGTIGKSYFLISTQLKDGQNSSEIANEVVKILEKKFPKYTQKKDLIRRSESVGPQIGKELKEKALKAVVYALLGIILYIWWRFKHFSYGTAAIIALAHDVVITLGVLSIFNIEMNLPIIAAILTLVGYSLNDTIVVFARIREDSIKDRAKLFPDIVNLSINQTLSRTVITSLTTLFVVFSLYILGGSVIHDFAFALLIGIVIGTYSSIFVASPLLVEDYLRKHKRK